MRRKAENIYFYVLIALVAIQPVLDIMWLNDGSIPEIFGFTIPTIVRMGMVAILAIFSFLVIDFNKKFFWLLGYAAILGIYFMGHQYNCMNFDSLVPGNFNYSIVGELFYVVRMCIPLSIIYFTYNSKIDNKIFDKICTGISLVMSISMIVTNLLKIGFGSYTSIRIDGNILDWFLNKSAFTSNQLASKGLFYSSITSTVMVLLYPYLLYLFLHKKKGSYLAIAVLHGIALFMFGTKATSFSVIIVSLLMFIIYLFCAIIKHDYAVTKIAVVGMIVIIAMNFILYSASPAMIKMGFDKEYAKERDEEDTTKEYMLSEADREQLIEFFDNNYPYISIKEDFLLNSYPYKYDPVFWYKFYDEHVPSQRMQNRIVEEKMLQRVLEINNNKMDKWFGIGYTRTSSIYNLEKDFAYQYYSMGLIGAALLLGPYLLIILLAMGVMLWKFKDKCTLSNCSIVLGSGLICCLAYYSGNTMENLGITIVFGFVLGYFLKANMKKEIKMETADEK